MYYPFLRGKRHELSSLKRIASRVSCEKFKPIIEPVKKNAKSLVETVKILNENNIFPILIVNPIEGELKSSSAIELYKNLIDFKLNFIPCVAFSNKNVDSAEAATNYFIENEIKFSNYFKDEAIITNKNITNLAIENIIRVTSNTTTSFLNSTKNIVKISDSFNAQDRNADYPSIPYVFSDAHLNFNQSSNVIGFGDYQIIGESFSENGGPARAVALHITYIEPKNCNLLYIKHCVSTIDSGTTSNTAAKFLEALDALILFANITLSVDQTTLGFESFKNLHKRRHYPNLGPAKENSILHHMETITSYL